MTIKLDAITSGFCVICLLLNPCSVLVTGQMVGAGGVFRLPNGEHYRDRLLCVVWVTKLQGISSLKNFVLQINLFLEEIVFHGTHNLGFGRDSRDQWC